jgi:hypothetical protein
MLKKFYQQQNHQHEHLKINILNGKKNLNLFKFLFFSISLIFIPHILKNIFIYNYFLLFKTNIYISQIKKNIKLTWHNAYRIQERLFYKVSVVTRLRRWQQHAYWKNSSTREVDFLERSHLSRFGIWETKN